MSKPSESKFGRARLIVSVFMGVLMAGTVFWKSYELDEDYPVAQRLINAMIAEGEVNLLTIAPCIDHVSYSGIESGKIGIVADGYPIVDSIVVKDRKIVEKLLATFNAKKNDLTAECHDPRHGVSMSSNPDNFLLICFMCSNFQYRFKGTDGIGLFVPGKTDPLEEQFEELILALELEPPPNNCDEWGEPKRD